MAEVQVSKEELVELCAVDTELFGKTFFPRAVRNSTPAFHAQIDRYLDSPDRFVNIQVFRGGAKTTKFRVFMAKRISYGLSRTILLVSKSAGHAAKTLRWIRNAIERNSAWAQTFGLEKGDKWNDEELEIVHKGLGIVIWVVGYGITGSTRGLNFEDYRPDLILVDDVVDEENSLTPEARDKVKKLVHGALKYSLAPAIDNPYAKLVILQTPLAFGDISDQAFKDPLFVSLRCGCWTPETENLPLEQRRSSWEERFPTADLVKDKLAAIQKNELSIFSKEMECRLISAESSTFKAEWLNYWGSDLEMKLPPIHEMWIEMAIDPVPPPSEQQIAKGLEKKDYESLAVAGKWRGKIFLLETSYNRGHDPSWTVAEFFRLAQKWQPKKVMVESVAYQRTLSWLLKQGMKTVGRYWPIQEVTDRRSKLDRISQGLKGVTSNGQFYCSPSESEFISQFTNHPALEHDDVLESVAVVSASLQGQILDEQAQEVIDDESSIAELEYERGCP